MEEDKKVSILILTADAGFGHRSAANAILAALEEKYSEKVELNIVNALDHEDTPVFLRETQSDYDKWIKNVPELYRFGYELSDGLVPTTILERVLTAFLARVMSTIIEQFRPTIIVSTYPLYQAPLKTALADLSLTTPVVTILTDLSTLHMIWFFPEVDMNVVPNAAVKELALDYGISEDRIFVSGIPVNPEIEKFKGRKREFQKELGWDTEKITVLCVGSARMENFVEMVDVLNHSGFDLQLILIAGKDDELYAELSETTWHQSVQLYQFVEEMPKFLSASDLILCKAGGLIVTEALAAGLPLLLVDVIPGQETGNAEYVEEHQAGFWIKSPMLLLESFAHLAADDYRLLSEMQKNATQAGNPLAAGQIADKVMEMVEALQNIE